jgi:phosphoglycolate phosphatase-like HAD superfamily hydrolase
VTSSNNRAHLPAWDAFDAYLFDIDGTLLRDPSRIHVTAFADCASEVLGRPVSLKGVTVHGSTDAAILRDACRLAGVDDEHWTPLAPVIFDRLTRMVHERRHLMQVTLMPGVEPVLAHLAARGATLGVATGNLESIGWLKLELAGLRHHFTFGGFSDRFAVRAQMIAHAAAIARSHTSSGASLCVVGDTPSDVSAAHANNIPCIAVATSIYPLDALRAAGAEWVVPSLADLLPANHSAPSASNTQSNHA